MDDIISLIAVFAPLFSARVWPHAQRLLLGAMLAPQSRTVTAMLRVMGRSQARDFTTYHRVLNRDRWSLRQGRRLLLGVLVGLFVPDGRPLILGADDTIERRRGERIPHLGCYRDAVRSSQKHVIHCFGLKWVSMMRLVPVPWSDRVWALPFLTGLSDPGDETPAGEPTASGSKRRRWDAALYHPPPQRPSQGQRGRPPKKGPRQRPLPEWADRADTSWVKAHISWYGGKQKIMGLCSRQALWYTPGWDPLPIRWVMVRDPQGKLRDEVFFCTDSEADPVQILAWVVMRWSVEVTFEEARAHLGMETQRPWSAPAIQRTTPIILGLYSIVTWITAHLAQQEAIPIQTTAWYRKPKVTFSDGLFLVRKHLWQNQIANYVRSVPDDDIMPLTPEILDLLLMLGYLKAA